MSDLQARLESALESVEAGVRPTLSEWLDLEPLDRAAWLEAARVIRRRDRAALAVAIARPGASVRDAARSVGDEATIAILADAEREALLSKGVSHAP